jgi:hypothetical protein
MRVGINEARILFNLICATFASFMHIGMSGADNSGPLGLCFLCQPIFKCHPRMLPSSGRALCISGMEDCASKRLMMLHQGLHVASSYRVSQPHETTLNDYRFWISIE